MVPLVACEKAENNPPVRPNTPQAPPMLTGDLVEINRLDRSIQLDIRYATPDNFTGRQLYDQARAFLVQPAANALVQAHQAAKHHGFGLSIYDAYRPWRITKALWDATPPGPKRNYVANPKRGSKHNRGCAVDLTLHSATDGVQVSMPSGYDEFSSRAHRNFMDAPPDALRHRALLQQVMEASGFRGASNEWWHFDFTNWQEYPVLDVPFAELK
jgi:zinc D-Ala-D-Ala dipeptidase